MSLRNLPMRLAAGAYILNSGLTKWQAGEETAAGLQGMAAGAYPQVKQVDAPTFLKGLSGAEIATGALLVTPFVPARLAGAALTVFAGGLVGMYARLPGMRKPGSIWPSNEGLALSKDMWLLGIGLSLLADSPKRKARAHD